MPENTQTVPTVGDLLDVLETIAPSSLAESWDNPGLQVGSREWPAARVQVALDALPQVVRAAAGNNVDLLVTHHPLIFRPLACVDLQRPSGEIIAAALGGHMAIVAAHTNLDSAAGGLNDLLARRLGLTGLRPLRPAENRADGEAGHGLGRVGRLERPMQLEEYAQRIKRRLGVDTLRVVGRRDLNVGTAAVCSGSGSGLLKDFLAAEADVYVSGDLGYHDARDVEAAGRGMIDVGHFGGEHPVVELLRERIVAELDRRGLFAEVEPCGLEADPFAVV